MFELIFYISFIFIVFTYVGYPLILLIASVLLKREVKRGIFEPSVTIIIPVYNEESLIRKKIENCLAINYPKEKLKIIVSSDCSSDNTEDIVNGFRDKNVEFLSLPERGGKVCVQNYAIKFVESEIIIFTDVAITTDGDCVKRIVENFNDQSIGAVSCSDDIITGEDQSEGESSYIKYDMFVRKYTSRFSSLIGVTGGFYATRKNIASGGWDPSFPPDFYVALKCIRNGLRVVEDARVKACYKTVADGGDELQRKIRTITRGMCALFANWELLNLFKYGFPSCELICHKLLRWLTPLFFALLLVSNIFIWNRSVFTNISLLLQLILYSFAMIAYLGGKTFKKNFSFRLSFFFCLANFAIMKSWYEFITRKKYIKWQPTKR